MRENSRTDHFTHHTTVTRIAELAGDGVDVVFDGVGGEVTRRSYRALRKGGRLVMYGHYSTLHHGRKDQLKVLTFYANAAAVLVQNLVVGRKRADQRRRTIRPRGDQVASLLFSPL